MATAPPSFDYDWAVLRLVPHPHVGAFEAVGVMLHARRARFLGVRLHPDPAGLAARWPPLERSLLTRYFDAVRRVAEGGETSGPIGLLPPSERFGWLVAVRSTVLQASPVHTGRARDLPAALDALHAMHVAAPGGP